MPPPLIIGKSAERRYKGCLALTPGCLNWVGNAGWCKFRGMAQTFVLENLRFRRNLSLLSNSPRELSIRERTVENAGP